MRRGQAFAIHAPRLAHGSQTRSWSARHDAPGASRPFRYIVAEEAKAVLRAFMSLTVEVRRELVQLINKRFRAPPEPIEKCEA
jgi:hypothetical protein